MIDRIDAEYARYFTPTGRPTGEWAAAVARLAAADEEVARCAEAVNKVDECVSRHAELSGWLGELGTQRKSAHERLTAARAAAAAVAELTAELREAEVMSAAAQATADASAAALTERRRQIGDVDERVGAVAGLEAAAVEAAEHESVAAEVCDVAAAAAEQSSAMVEDAQACADAARATVDRLSDREEATRLTARLAKIDSARAELQRAENEITANTITDAVLRDVEVAATAVERASGLAELACARIELTSPADLEVLVGGSAVRLSAQQTLTLGAAAATDVEVPGVLHARVVPGAPACDTQATLDAARRHLDDVLAAAGVADLAGARAQAEQRRELISERDRLTATLLGLCGDEPADELRCRLATLHARAGDSGDADTDAASARAALDVATAAHREASAQCQRDRELATAAAAALAEKRTAAAVLREKLTTARAELDAARQRLSQQRATVDDERLQACAQTDSHAAEQAAARVADVRARLAEKAADEVAAELGAAEDHADDVNRDHDAVAAELRDLATQLRIYGTEGRQGGLDEAEAERAHAHSEWVRVGRRARAARLLRSVILRHRDDTRLRYVEPFRAEVGATGPDRCSVTASRSRSTAPCESAAGPSTGARCPTSRCPAARRSSWASWPGSPERRWSPRRTPCR